MAGMLQSQRYCRTCQRKTLHARPAFSNAAGCFLTLLTFGLFLPFWIAGNLLKIGDGPWRCQVCGRKRWT